MISLKYHVTKHSDKKRSFLITNYAWLYLSLTIDGLCLVEIVWWIVLAIALALAMVLLLLVIRVKKKGSCSLPVNNGKHPRGEYFPF